MNWEEARMRLLDGAAVKLPEWTGFWYNDHGAIKVLTKRGDILETPMVEENKHRIDWLIADGSLGFEFAIGCLMNKKKVTRKSAAIPGCYIIADFPDVNSRITSPLILMVMPADVRVLPSHENYKEQRIPWQPSYADLFATDWVLVED